MIGQRTRAGKKVGGCAHRAWQQAELSKDKGGEGEKDSGRGKWDSFPGSGREEKSKTDARSTRDSGGQRKREKRKKTGKKTKQNRDTHTQKKKKRVERRERERDEGKGRYVQDEIEGGCDGAC